MIKGVWIITVIFFAALTGCAGVNDYLDIAKDKGISKDYARVLGSWTRQKTIYSQFETKVHISATYKSAEFMTGYQKEYSRIYHQMPHGQPPDGKAPAVFDAEYREFLFYAALPDRDANDFESPRSVWKIYLVNGTGEQSGPVEIRRISKVSAITEAFYPYINKYYGYCYQLKFRNEVQGPKETAKADDKPFKLIFTSVLGKVELEWN